MKALIPLTALFLCAALTPAVRAEEAKPDKDAIQGTWKLVAVADGANEDTKPAETTLLFEGDKAFEMKNGERRDPATIKLDSTKTPKEMDISPGDKTIKAIYELKGDTLRICLSGPDKPRPKEFKATEDVTVMTFQRQKGS